MKKIVVSTLIAASFASCEKSINKTGRFVGQKFQRSYSNGFSGDFMHQDVYFETDKIFAVTHLSVPIGTTDTNRKIDRFEYSPIKKGRIEGVSFSQPTFRCILQMEEDSLCFIDEFTGQVLQPELIKLHRYE